MAPITVRTAIIAATMLAAALLGDVTASRAQIECFTCLDTCASNAVQCLAACPPPDTLAGIRCENRCELNEVLCSFKCQDTQCFIGGAGLGGFWEEVAQDCTGAGADLSCSLRGTFIAVNPGTETASPSILLFVLSRNRNLDANDTILDRVRLGALQPGEQKARQLNVDLPEGVSASGQYVIAVLDAAADLFEADEGNNIVPSERIE